MTVYHITYNIRGKDKLSDVSVNAKDLASAKKKIGKRYGYTDGRMINIQRVIVVGYF